MTKWGRPGQIFFNTVNSKASSQVPLVGFKVPLHKFFNSFNRQEQEFLLSTISKIKKICFEFSKVKCSKVEQGQVLL